MLDRSSLHTIFGIELSLVLWLLGKTVGISWMSKEERFWRVLLWFWLVKSSIDGYWINRFCTEQMKLRRDKSIHSFFYHHLLHNILYTLCISLLLYNALTKDWPRTFMWYPLIDGMFIIFPHFYLFLSAFRMTKKNSVFYARTLHSFTSVLHSKDSYRINIQA